MIGLSGIEYKILILGMNIFTGYSVTMHGPWYFRLLYDLGILQIYINRLVNQGLLEEVCTGWNYKTTGKGSLLIIKYWMAHEFENADLI